MLSERKTKGRGVYFVGIGGVSMSALALLLHGRGIPVRGSDCAEGPFTRKLKREGIGVSIGEEEEIVEETVVYTGAVTTAHPQLSAAAKAGKRLVGRAELLGKIAEEYPHVLSVSGCHGKTTTTSMLSHIFYANEKPFTCHIGGEDLTLGNFFRSGDEYFVTEACEFRRSFLTLRSEVGVILNCDRDHTDCYKDEEELFRAYESFASNCKKLVVNADDRRARTLPHTLSFGVYAGDIRAERIASEGEKYAFTVVEKGIPVVRVRLRAVGRVHVYNALAAYSAARLSGLGPEEIRRGLESFLGVKRRFERVGTFLGTPVVCDYAHHPREIAAAISTAERLSVGTVRVVFQPHTYTRTRDLLPSFVEVLRRAERPILYKTYSAREKFDFAGSAAMLLSRVPEAVYAQSPEVLKRRLAEKLEEGDLILVLGAGDIDAVARSLLDKTPTAD